MDAIEHRDEYLAMPRLIYTLPLLRFLLPVSWLDVVLEVLGASATMDSFVGR